MKTILSILALVMFAAFSVADEPAKTKSRARAALALAAASEGDVKPPVKTEVKTVLTDLAEAKRKAAVENKPLVIWVGCDPMDIADAVHVTQAEHAGICGHKAAIVYSAGGGKVSTEGHVEYQPTRDKVVEQVKKNTPPPASFTKPSAVVPVTVAESPFFVMAAPAQAVCRTPV